MDSSPLGSSVHGISGARNQKKKRNKEYVLEGGSVWEGISTGPTASEGMDCTGLGDASAETTM